LLAQFQGVYRPTVASNDGATIAYNIAHFCHFVNSFAEILTKYSALSTEPTLCPGLLQTVAGFSIAAILHAKA
jgi:hypothetical protein